MRCKADNRLRTRESGVELLKIIAIFFIVINHVVQSLCAKNGYMPSQDYVILISDATTDIRCFLLVLMRYFGVWGNDLFFICSAWFLLQSDTFSRKKWLTLLLEVWTVSVLVLCAVCLFTDIRISKSTLMKCLLPTTFSTNWYMTCYLLFYPIHPLLNRIIYQMEQRTLLRLSLAMVVLYCGFNAFRGFFFPSTLILWITVYFAVAYVRLYMQDFCGSIKWNSITLCVCILCCVLLSAGTNFAGLHYHALHDKMLHWADNCNPFLIAASIAMLNLFRRLKFKSAAVNYIAGLSFLIYILHENIFLRTYFRPAAWSYIHARFGYDHVLLWVLLFSLLLYIGSLALSVLYDQTIRKAILPVSNAAFGTCKKIYARIENRLLKVR